MRKKVIVGAVAALSLVAFLAAFPVFKSIGSQDVKAAGEVRASKSVDEKEVENLVVKTETQENVIDPNDTYPYDEVVKNSENMYYINAPGNSSAEEAYVKPDFFEDPAIRKLAEKYSKDGMYLTDAERDAKDYGVGTGVGAFVFTKGFNAVDDITGNNTCFISVVKATPSEFKSFVDNFKYELKVKKKDFVTVATYDDSMNHFEITYDQKNGIIEYVNKFLMNGIG